MHLIAAVEYWNYVCICRWNHKLYICNCGMVVENWKNVSFT